jgi:hypothetical protein
MLYEHCVHVIGLFSLCCTNLIHVQMDKLKTYSFRKLFLESH